jgi:hypothetical protein
MKRSSVDLAAVRESAVSTEVEDVARAALEAFDAGLSPIPIRADGSKSPAIARWKQYQVRRPERAQVEEWFAPQRGHRGLGIVGGAVSCNTEFLDFDTPDIYSKFLMAAKQKGLGDLVHRAEQGYHAQTPGGDHLAWRCDPAGRSQKLARRLKRPEEQKHENDRVKTLIETKSERAYSLAPPSNGRVHPSGRGYRFVSGGFREIVTITPDERETLIEVARSFDEMPPQKSQTNGRREGCSGPRPGDHYNATGCWRELLSKHGWQIHHEQGDEIFWTRPGKDPAEGLSASTNYNGSNLLYVWSTSTPFESERSYDLFGAVAVLEHGGDLRAAAQELLRRERDQQVADGVGEPMRDSLAQPSALRVLTHEEILEDPEPEYVVEGLLVRRAVSALCGWAKTGKSMLATQRAMCAALGIAFLGLAVPRPLRVLYLALEMSAALMRKRIYAIARDCEIDLGSAEHLFSDQLLLLAPTKKSGTVRATLSTDEGAREIIRLVNDTGAEIAELDTLYRFCIGLDPNDHAAMSPICDRLHWIAAETGAAVDVIDHAPKAWASALGGSTANAMIGSVVKAGSFNIIATVARDKRDEGGAWVLDVDTHYEWSGPIHYRQPRLPASDPGAPVEYGIGCERIDAAEAKGVSWGKVLAAFDNAPQRDVRGRPTFPSQSKFIEALAHVGAVSRENNREAGQVVKAIEQTYGCGLVLPTGAVPFDPEPKNASAFPVLVVKHGERKNAPKSYTLLRAESESRTEEDR